LTAGKTANKITATLILAMNQPVEISDTDVSAEGAASADKTMDLRYSEQEEGDIFCVDTKSPETRIALTQMRVRLREQHMAWIFEDPMKTDFDPTVIQISMIEDLLTIGQTHIGRLATQLGDAYGYHLPREKMENARQEIRSRLKNGNDA